jgi:hypothetical protein
LPYSSKIQQRLGAKLPPEPLERVERLGIGNLRKDVHRHVDLRMAQDVSVGQRPRPITAPK